MDEGSQRILQGFWQSNIDRDRQSRNDHSRVGQYGLALLKDTSCWTFLYERNFDFMVSWALLGPLSVRQVLKMTPRSIYRLSFCWYSYTSSIEQVHPKYTKDYPYKWIPRYLPDLGPRSKRKMGSKFSKVVSSIGSMEPRPSFIKDSIFLAQRVPIVDRVSVYQTQNEYTTAHKVDPWTVIVETWKLKLDIEWPSNSGWFYLILFSRGQDPRSGIYKCPDL